MQIDKLQPNLNKTSLFMQEPFFSDVQIFKDYEGYFIPICSNERKKANTQPPRQKARKEVIK